jgi:hypothetical protein
MTLAIRHQENRHNGWLVIIYFLLATLYLQTIVLGSSYKPSEVTTQHNPFTVLGLDPVGFSSEDLENTYAFWQRVHSQAPALDPTNKEALKEINEAYDLIKNPDRLKAYIEKRKLLSQESDHSLFSVSTQDLGHFLDRRFLELEQGLFTESDSLKVLLMIYNLQAALERDLSQYPKESIRTQIQDYFENRIRVVQVKFIEKLWETARSKHEQAITHGKIFVLKKNSHFYNQLIDRYVSLYGLADYDTFLRLRTLLNPMILDQNIESLATLDQALGAYLLQNKNRPDIQQFFKNLSPNQLGHIRYFTPNLGEINCRLGIRYLLAHR